MAGPSGFVKRFKGKVAFPVGGIWVGGVSIADSAADLNTSVGWGTVQTSTGSSVAVQLSTSRVGGLDVIAPTASTAGGGAIYRLPPPVPGVVKLIDYSTINGSTILFLTVSTAGAVTIAGVGSTGSTASFAGTGGSTLSNTIKSTQSCQIEMIGQTTAIWLFNGIVPSTTGHLTFSTST